MIGVIRDGNDDIAGGEIAQLVLSTVVIVHIRLFGLSNSLKRVFQA